LEVNIKNYLGEKNVKESEFIYVAWHRKGAGCIKSGDKASGYIKFRRFLE
jgi:hypothetical protein